MSFTSPLGIKVQLNLPGLGWTDIVRDNTKPYRVLAENGIYINRGRSSEQSRVATSTMTCEMYDPTGVFNNENPRSSLYGILPRNCGIRFYVRRPTTALLMINAFNFGAGVGGRSSTTSKAAVQPTGDVDIRMDFDPSLNRRRGKGYILCSKYNPTGNMRQWSLRVDANGFPAYNWSTDGTIGAASSATSTVPLPTTGRIALRVFHDINIAGTTSSVTFATASTINGAYTTLSTINFPTITTVFTTGTAEVEIGTGSGQSFVFNNYQVFVGRVYGFQLRNAATTLVGNADFTAQTTGTTSFSDGLGNTWVNGGVVEITDADYRFYGEATFRQVPESTSQNTHTAIEAHGLLARLTTNSVPLKSPLYSFLILKSPTLYLPCEDGSTSTVVGSAVTSAPGAPITDITFGTDTTGLPGSSGNIVCGSTGPTLTATAAPSAAGNTTCSFMGFFKFPSVPLSGQTLFSLYSTGTAARVDYVVTATNYQLMAYNTAGTLIGSVINAFGAGAEPNNNCVVWINVTQSGGNTTLTMQWLAITQQFLYFASTPLVYVGTAGTFNRLVVQGVAALNNVKLAHLCISNSSSLGISTSGISAARGNAGETAASRFIRLCQENSVPFIVDGAEADSELMGPQAADELVNLLYECQDVDGGELGEARDQLALRYKTRVSMQNQYGLGLSYTVGKQLTNVLVPTPDNEGIRNDVTLTRRNGVSDRETLDVGAMSTLDPSLGGIGRVPSKDTINNYVDSRVPALTQYALGMGTWPDPRYPAVSLGLHRTAFGNWDANMLLAAKTDLGELIGITDLPTFMRPDAIYLIVRGVTENYTQDMWDISWNCSPGRPYITNELSSTAGNEQKRADSSNTVLNAAITSTATSASFKTTTGALCVTTATKPAEFPFDVMIGGERITVTAIVGTTSPQAATITRSVNGIIKAQVINAPVTLPADTAFYVTM